jgi:DNA helicase-2/ATP-dependent DNA helicase PcrA
VVQKINAVSRKMTWGVQGNDGVFEAMMTAGAVVPDQAHLVDDITATIEALIVQKDRVTLGEFIYNLLRNDTGLYQHALHEESGQDLLLLNTFIRITQDYEAISRKNTLQDFLAYLDLLSGISVEVGEREDKDAVRILTVHKSKGKEYPVVFVVDMVKDSSRCVPDQLLFVPSDLAKG